MANSTRSPSPNGSNGRDTSGKFAKGNSGGPGNPYARRVAQMRSIIAQEFTDEDLHQVARKLVDMAKNGDLAAAKLLLSYSVGRPVEPACDPDHVDAQEENTRAEELEAKARRVDAAKDADASKKFAALSSADRTSLARVSKLPGQRAARGKVERS
jgi:hypothetical protein